MNDIDTLVGGDWNMTFMFPYIGNAVIPTDFHIFQRGRYTTNQYGLNVVLIFMALIYGFHMVSSNPLAIALLWVSYG